MRESRYVTRTCVGVWYAQGHWLVAAAHLPLRKVSVLGLALFARCTCKGRAESRGSEYGIAILLLPVEHHRFDARALGRLNLLLRLLSRQFFSCERRNNRRGHEAPKNVDTERHITPQIEKETLELIGVGWRRGCIVDSAESGKKGFLNRPRYQPSLTAHVV